MIKTKINRKNLEIFLSNIRESDKNELIYYFGDNYKRKFVRIVLNNAKSTTMLSYKSKPACIGGTYKDDIGIQVWLLCSEEFDRKYLIKYLKNRIKELASTNEILYNIIYKSNFSSIKWLSKLGFKFINTDNPDCKFFYITRRNIN